MRFTSIIRTAVIAIAFLVGTVSTRAAETPFLTFDPATGEVLAENRAGEPWYPASLTKLVTAYIVFQKIKEGKLRLDQELYVSPLAARQPASRIGVPAGQTVQLDKAMQALLVYSANDMAYVLAEGASGTIADFSKDMNAFAKAAGLSASHFVNPNGLHDPRHISSARDMGLIAAMLIRDFPERRHYFSQEYVDFGKRRLPNRNMLIRLMEDADGMKTGFVCDSGFNLVASATRNGRTLISVIMGAKSGYGRAVQAKELLEAGFLTTPLPHPAKVLEIVNQPYGAIVPADMTPVVCRNKDRAEIADASGFEGWGVSFGRYDTAINADLALRGRMISPSGIDSPGFGALYKHPDATGIEALMWGLTPTAAMNTCKNYRNEKAPCELLPPQRLGLYAASQAMLVKRRQEQKANPVVAQGSDTEKSSTKAKALAKAPAKAKAVTKKATKERKTNKRVRKTIR